MILTAYVHWVSRVMLVTGEVRTGSIAHMSSQRWQRLVVSLPCMVLTMEEEEEDEPWPCGAMVDKVGRAVLNGGGCWQWGCPNQSLPSKSSDYYTVARANLRWSVATAPSVPAVCKGKKVGQRTTAARLTAPHHCCICYRGEKQKRHNLLAVFCLSPMDLLKPNFQLIYVENHCMQPFLLIVIFYPSLQNIERRREGARLRVIRKCLIEASPGKRYQFGLVKKIALIGAKNDMELAEAAAWLKVKLTEAKVAGFIEAGLRVGPITEAGAEVDQRDMGNRDGSLWRKEL
ncbi:hypothetical protein ACLOJK_023799 [Asimina triloba]